MNPNQDMSGLIPFVKGQSGNPAGKPVGTLSTKTILRRLLNGETELRDKEGNVVRVVTNEEAMHLKQLQKAKTGDTRAYNAILDRLEGKPIQKVETETKEVVEFASEKEIDAELSKHGIDPEAIE